MIVERSKKTLPGPYFRGGTYRFLKLRCLRVYALGAHHQLFFKRLPDKTHEKHS